MVSLFSFCCSFRRRRLSLWQLSYRDTFVQMIHANNGEILDCDFLTGRNFNEEFIQKFYDEIQKMRKTHRHLFESKGIARMPTFRHHLHHGHGMPEIDRTMDSDSELSGAVNITYLRLYSKTDIPDELRGMMNFAAIKDECDVHHQKVMQMADDLSSDSDEIVQNATNNLSR